MYYKRIHDLRIDNDLTQKDVANYLKIQQPHYARYECGDIEFPTRHIKKLADLFNVSTDYLLGRTDKKDINK